MKLRFHLCLAVLLACLARPLFADGPPDVAVPDMALAIHAIAGPNDQISVAWRNTTSGRIVLSMFSGANWGQTRQIELTNDRSLVGGLTRDGQGNRYVAVFKEEKATPAQWAQGYRPGVARLLRLAPGADQAEQIADLNSAEYSAKWPIINPLRFESDGCVNSQMLFNQGKLLLAFGHSNGTAEDIHSTGTLIGINSDGSPAYNEGGEQHPGEVALALDGTGFVKAQIFDQGIGLSKMVREGNNLRWTNFVLVYEIPRANQAEELLQIAGIVPTENGYLLVFASGKGWLWSTPQHDLGTDGDCQIKVMKVARDFDKHPKFDWWNNVRHAQGNYPLTTLARPAQNKSFIRPTLCRLPDGRAIVACEQWTKSGFETSPEGIVSIMLGADGRSQATQFHANARIQRSAVSFWLPRSQRIAWVNGEQGRLVVHTLDQELNHEATVLGAQAAPSNPPMPPIQAIAGRYQRKPVENEYHEGTLTLESQPGQAPVFVWRNKADVSWKVMGDGTSETFRTDDANPYFNDGEELRKVRFEFNKNAAGRYTGTVKGFHFGGELYERVGP